RRTDAQEREGSIATRVHTSAGTSPTGQWNTTDSGAYQSKRWTIAATDAFVAPPKTVTATRTTTVYPGFTGDVADGAAIYPDGANTAIITTNKDAGGGLYVYD